jgi:hypothetical protein
LLTEIRSFYSMKIAVFREVTLSVLRHITDVSDEPAASKLRVEEEAWRGYRSPTNLSSETSVNIYEISPRHTDTRYKTENLAVTAMRTSHLTFTCAAFLGCF